MNRVAKIALGSVALLAVATIYVLNPRLPEPENGLSATLYETGPLGIDSETVSLVDHSRATSPNGVFEGSPVRELEGFVWYPAERANKPFPLIVYSHGFMSSVAEPEYLIDFLVPKGYVVVAVNFPLSHGGAPGGPIVNDVINQPGDITFVIDTLLARNSDPEDSLYGVLDPERIAAVGLSLGGLTTELVTFHPYVSDKRVDAAISIAGPTAFFERKFFESSDIPFMMIAGSADAVIPYEAHAAPIPDKTDEGVLVTLEKGTHIGFAGISPVLMRWFDHPDKLVCPMLLDGLERSENGGENLLVPDEQIGISSISVRPCKVRSYERAMRPGHQQMLTRLAVYAFLERHFAEDPERRQKMGNYLENDFVAENSAVQVQ